MLLNSDFIRGHIDTMILNLLMKEDMYGYDISKVITQKTGGYKIKETTLYSSLRRLEKHQFIDSYFSSKTNGGSRRRYYKTTKIGLEQYRTLCEEWKKTKKVVNLFTEEQEDE